MHLKYQKSIPGLHFCCLLQMIGMKSYILQRLIGEIQDPQYYLLLWKSTRHVSTCNWSTPSSDFALVSHYINDINPHISEILKHPNPTETLTTTSSLCLCPSQSLWTRKNVGRCSSSFTWWPSSSAVALWSLQRGTWPRRTTRKPATPSLCRWVCWSPSDSPYPWRRSET